MPSNLSGPMKCFVAVVWVAVFAALVCFFGFRHGKVAIKPAPESTRFLLDPKAPAQWPKTEWQMYAGGAAMYLEALVDSGYANMSYFTNTHTLVAEKNGVTMSLTIVK